MKYKERQRVNDRVLYGFLILALAGFIFGLVYSAINHGILSTQCLLYLILAAVVSGLLWWYRQLTIKISIDDNRIKFRMKPLEKNAHKIPWKDVVSCKIVSEPRFTKWAGSNIHFSNEELYSFHGRNGLQIETRDGHQYVVGCQNTAKLEEVLNEMGVMKKSK